MLSLSIYIFSYLIWESCEQTLQKSNFIFFCDLFVGCPYKIKILFKFIQKLSNLRFIYLFLGYKLLNFFNGDLFDYHFFLKQLSLSDRIFSDLEFYICLSNCFRLIFFLYILDFNLLKRILILGAFLFFFISLKRLFYLFHDMWVVCHGLELIYINAVIFLYSEYHPKASSYQFDGPQ